MEDDCYLDIVRYWNFDWKSVVAKFPYDWDVVQLAIICTGDIHINLHRRFVNDFSTACYVITRHHAEKLIRNHIRGDKYKLDNGIKPRAVADDLIYNSGCTYSAPLLLYRTELGSTIHPDHVDLFHKRSYEGIFNFWKQQGCQMTVEQLTSFDPYLGRISASSGQQNP